MFGKDPFSGTFNLPQLPEPMYNKRYYEDAIDRSKTFKLVVVKGNNMANSAVKGEFQQTFSSKRAKR